jgi:hypothetical protein
MKGSSSTVLLWLQLMSTQQRTLRNGRDRSCVLGEMVGIEPSVPLRLRVLGAAVSVLISGWSSSSPSTPPHPRRRGWLCGVLPGQSAAEHVWSWDGLGWAGPCQFHRGAKHTGPEPARSCIHGFIGPTI